MRRWLRLGGLVGLGLAVGLGLGLYLGWSAWPTQFTNAIPQILQESYRRDYTKMIAAAYAVDGNLPAATERIDSLGPEGREFLYAVTLDAILRDEEEAVIRQLVRLAADLGMDSPALDPYLAGTEDAGTSTP